LITVPELAIPRAPKGLQARGRKLWQSVLSLYTLEGHEMVTLEQACRCADRLERLAEEGRSGPLTVENSRGDVVSNPALVESRQQEITYIRLIASLRLPDSDDGVRPQRRSGARAPYAHRKDFWAVSS
jgi:hypothetical protein